MKCAEGEKLKKSKTEQSIDETHLIDTSMPSDWRCPHCLKENHSGELADEILLEHGKYLEHCERCGCVHIWTLELTDKFKREAIDLLMKWATEKEPPKLKKKHIEI